MLARLLSGCVPVAHESAGAIFIDRDGDLFRHVLAFLRDARLVTWAGRNSDGPALRFALPFL